MDWIALYLEEDLGDEGDVTSDALFAPDDDGQAVMAVRQPCVVAGLEHAIDVFSRLGADARRVAADGDTVESGQVLLAVQGPVRAILAGERLALNIVARMSAVATRTRRLADALADAGSQARVAATRKTTPGFRAFEKEAVRIGGGDPHRMGLFDACMVKDNHIAAAGDVAAAVRKVREAQPEKTLTVEVEREEDALAAARAGADWIMVDNQSPDTGRVWAQAVRDAVPGIRVEASGGIRDEEVVAYGWADRISLGSLTGRAGVDVGLDWR